MNFYLPEEMICKRVQKKINDIKIKNTLIVGIHLRRGRL